MQSKLVSKCEPKRFYISVLVAIVLLFSVCFKTAMATDKIPTPSQFDRDSRGKIEWQVTEEVNALKATINQYIIGYEGSDLEGYRLTKFALKMPVEQFFDNTSYIANILAHEAANRLHRVKNVLTGSITP